MSKIPYNAHYIDKNDEKHVVKTLNSKFLTQGIRVLEFERMLCQNFKSKYSSTFNSASSALYVACRVMGLNKNDIVWTSAITYAAGANCALLCGAEVKFLDIDLKDYNISIDELEVECHKAKKKNKLPKVLIITDLAGEPCELEKIDRLKKKYKFKIIIDASHSIGSLYKNNPVGNNKYSDLTVFSFHPIKNITTAEGGAIMTNEKSIKIKIDLIKNNGINKNPNNYVYKKNKIGWYYEQVMLGGNYRMNDIQASLGISQLKKLSIFIKKRRLIAKKYVNSLKVLNQYIELPKYDPKNICSYHLFIIRLRLPSLKLKNKLYKYFLKHDIITSFHYIPLYRHPFFRKKKCKSLKNCEIYYKSALSIPIFYALSEKKQNKIIKLLKLFFIK